MSFFIRGKHKGSSNKKRLSSKSKTVGKNAEQKNIPRKRKIQSDEEIPSDSEIESDDVADSHDQERVTSSEDEAETAQEKRLRLAKEYLAQIEAEEEEKREDDEALDHLVADRLKTDILAQTGRLHRDVADEYLRPTESGVKVCKGHRLSVTCVVISSYAKWVFSGSKDCSIIKWNSETGQKCHVIKGCWKQKTDRVQGHSSHVLCLALSHDDKFLVSGDRNKLICVWNPVSCQLIHHFTGHRGPVSGVAFQRGTHQLFSSSHDRTVKLWNLDEMAYVETLFGHQDIITGIDGMARERAVTSGGRDGSVRVWKIVDESQLVFHGHTGSIDCLCLFDDNHFLSGADDNSLALWSLLKKKPIAFVRNAHSAIQENGVGEGRVTTACDKEHWISAVAALYNTDLAVSGSKDGLLRFWRCNSDAKTMSPLFTYPVIGFINSLKFSGCGNYLAVGVGQEHSLGRWWSIKEARNCVLIMKLDKLENEKHATRSK